MSALTRLTAPALIIAALFAPTAAFAGASENALLAKYAGNWAGNGKLTGVGVGDLECTMNMKPAKTGALTYTGKCKGPLGSSSFKGSMSYDDKAGQFTATSSGAGVGATVIGKKAGGGISFDMKGTKTPIGTASSTMSLTGKAIKINFKVQEKKGLTSSLITFSRI